MNGFLGVVALVLNIYFYVLLARVLLGYLLAFNPSYRPTGGVAALFEFVYTVTDPPVKFLDRFIPPLRMGRYVLGLSVLVLLIGIRILIPVLLNS